LSHDVLPGLKIIQVCDKRKSSIIHNQRGCMMQKIVLNH